MNLTLKVWRQDGHDAPGRFETFEARDISPDASFLEMLDVINDRLEAAGKTPIAFESDCREGICGVCGVVINGVAHGHVERSTICQLHMRSFKDGDVLTIEPWRAKAFPVIKDLIVDRSALDRIIVAGGFIVADRAMDAAACIGCGACVAACPNAAAMLFTGAKVTHLNVLPQGEPERYQRAQAMTDQMNKEGFGHCTNYQECVKACPKGIPLDVISRMNRDLIMAQFKLR